MTLVPEQLHVIRLYPRLPPLSGGMERHIASLTAAQRQLGLRVTEVYNRGAPAGESIQLWPGQALGRLRPAALRDLLFYGAAILRRGEIASGGVRIVHAHGDWSAFLLAHRLARAIGARATAASLHEWARAAPHLYRIALRECSPIFATGLTEARRLSELTGKPVRHLPSAPDEVFFAPPQAHTPAIDVIAVGSLIPRKNIDLLIACAARRPNATFAVYGEGPERDRLEKHVRREGLNNLRFHGAVPIEDVHSAMASARLFVNLASAEGSPTAALEAMACRLPVLLTPSNDYSEIVEPGVNGRVTTGWEVDELVAGIDEFIGNPERRRAAGEASRKIAERHRWADKARVVTAAMLAAAEANQR